MYGIENPMQTRRHKRMQKSSWSLLIAFFNFTRCVTRHWLSDDYHNKEQSNNGTERIPERAARLALCMQNAWKAAGILAEQQPVQGIAKETDDPRTNAPGINVSRSLTLLSKHLLWCLYSNGPCLYQHGKIEQSTLQCRETIGFNFSPYDVELVKMKVMIGRGT
jgi:hypothetical protein